MQYKRFLRVITYFITIITFTILFNVHAQSTVELDPIILSRLDTTSIVQRSIYNIDAQFSDSDTILFVNKEIGLGVVSLDSIGPNELLCTLVISPGFTRLGPREFYIIGSNGKRKAKAVFSVLWGPQPAIERVWFSSAGDTRQDTLALSRYGTTVVNMAIVGTGLFSSTRIEFDDPAIQVVDDVVHRRTFVPDSIKIKVVVNADKKLPQIGHHRLNLSNPFAREVESMIIVRGAFAPRITGAIENFVADGTEHKITVFGSGFAEGCSISTIPREKNSRYKWVSANKMELFLTMPVLEHNTNYRIVITNPDAQADTSDYFIVMSKPLASARLKGTDAPALFMGKKVRAEFTVTTRPLTGLASRRNYEVNIEGLRFAVERIKDDSTLAAVIEVPQEPTEADLIYKNFSIGESGKVALWKGVLQVKIPPKLTYMSPFRIIHPVDTLIVLLKGSHLEKVTVSIDDPEVTIGVEESSYELMRLKVIAGKRVTPGKYALSLKKNGVSFRFDEYSVKVRDWLEFDRFVGMHIGSLGALRSDTLWSGTGKSHHIETNDQVVVKFFAGKIPPEFGSQKILISGMLTDSVSTVKAEAIDKKMLIIEPGSDIIAWRFRVRQQIRSGDRIEITLQNPGGQNRAMESFAVEPHWSEFFHGSTSLILFKIPFGDGKSATEILRSASFGISWQPSRYSRFVEFDMSFIVGNVVTGEQTISVEVGLGLSAILWNHLQVGFGTNLTGDSFTEGFTFVATRFKLPFPWRP